MGWTEDQIPDQSGRTIVITGANSGLGLECTRALAGAGGHVVLACRSAAKAETAIEHVRSLHSGASLTFQELDLSSLESVKSFAEQFVDEHKKLDLLINNAGVMALPQRKTLDGFEMQFGTNHLGHFALTGRLLDTLTDTEDSRVVTVSSAMHKQGRMQFSDLQHEKNYEKWRVYSQSKLANLLFALELHRRLLVRDSGVTSVAAHPGYAATNLQQGGPQMSGSKLRQFGMKVMNVAAQSAKAGAASILMAATSPDVSGGDYYGPQLLDWWGAPGLAKVAPQAHDIDAAERLWEISAELTGVSYLV